MDAPLTVAFDQAAQDSGAIAQVIASLPVSLARGSEAGGLDGIDGGAGWPAAAERAIDAGARGLLIVRPVPADAASLVESAAARGVPVVIDAMWTHDPAVELSAASFAEVADDRCLLEARVSSAVGSEWHRVLLDQLSVIRAAVSPVRSLDVIRRDRTGYSATAVLATGGRVNLTAIGTDSVAASATLRIVNQQRVVQLTVLDPATAAPGRVVVTSPAGANELESVWETAHRAAWRRLVALVRQGETSRDLEFFADDCAVAAAW